MKRKFLFLILVLVIVCFTACAKTSISTQGYDEISIYVMDNKDSISIEKELEFFDYEAKGLTVGGVYYGYYYTANNEVVVPDFYADDNLGERYEADGGTYFGKPNNGTDWCFVKQITDNWYYYELHWG